MTRPLARAAFALLFAALPAAASLAPQEIELEVQLESAQEARLQSVLRKLLASDDILVIVDMDLAADSRPRLTELLPGVPMKDIPASADMPMLVKSVVRSMNATIILDDALPAEAKDIAEQNAAKVLSMDLARGDTVEVKRARLRAQLSAAPAPAREWLKPEDFVPSVAVELETDFAALSPAVVQEVNRMAPFGIGNPRPVLSSSNVTAVGTRKKLWGDRFQVFLRQEKRVWPAIGPAAIVNELENNVPVEVAYTPKEAFRDPEGVELELKAARLISL